MGRCHGKCHKVKRAAPGGEGNVVDPYSPAAMDAYLGAFDKAFAGFNAPMPRAHFHDSFEYYKAEWTPALFDEFRKLRGYDLRAHLPEFFGEGDPAMASLVKADYRATISDLHRDYLLRWKDWAHEKGSLVREQAHGSPGNLLDHYAVADIPETEIFQDVDERGIPMLQLASSAAHVTGRNLTSCESFTWLDEHFQVKPSKLKDAADYVFLCGVNHIFFHGIPYSPEDVPWPGWVFYASTHMGPNGGLWHDMPAFTGYISRVQSALQSGRPDGEVLVYFPMDDIRSQGGGNLPLLSVHEQSHWLWPTPFYRAAMDLWKQGVAADFVSDDLLANAEVKDGRIVLGGVPYQTLLLPDVRLMPVETLRRILKLVSDGAKVALQGDWPQAAPGYAARGTWDAEFGKLWGKDRPPVCKADGMETWDFGKGRVVRLAQKQALDIPALADFAELHPEPMSAFGLRFVRRAQGDGSVYFIANRSANRFDGVLPLARPVRSAVLLDPRFPGRSGVARIKQGGVVMTLEPGESCVLRVFSKKEVTGRPWPYLVPSGDPVEIEGKGRIEFLEGGPVLPKAAEFSSLASWTTFPDPEALRFAGTARYTIRFASPATKADEWTLDLGRVCETARVRVNGKDAGVLWSSPFRLAVGRFLQPGVNTMEVDVTNLAANRIADLDRRKVDWKRFHEINFVNINYKPFDASGWPTFDSGLLGPVRLIPGKVAP
jgi:hypothetical protein